MHSAHAVPRNMVSEHHAWLPQWGSVLFTDGSRFCLGSAPWRLFIWRAPWTRYDAANIVEIDRYGDGGVRVRGIILYT